MVNYNKLDEVLAQNTAKNQKKNNKATNKKKPKIEPKKAYPLSRDEYEKMSLEHYISELEKLDNVADNYEEWVYDVGFALATLGENGRDYFHRVSQLSTKYDSNKCDKKFDNLIKTTNHDGIGNFIKFCKNLGIEVYKPPQDKRLFTQPKQTPEDIQDTPPEKGEPAGAEQENQQEQPTKSKKEKGKVAFLMESIAQFFNEKGVRKNLVTNFLEKNGNMLKSVDINTLYIERIEEVQTKRDMFNLVLNSHRINSYNPFFEFFEKNKNKGTKGTIKKLCESILTDTGKDEKEADYLELFFTKWIVGMIACIYPRQHNPLILVLTGSQNSGKTYFFRNLLPESLQNYYAESHLDKGKDDELLMCQKLLILDDEYSGKSKVESKELKRLVSANQFTLREPYGKMNASFNRVATLCGTSNEQDLIYDYTGNRRVIPVNVISRNTKLFDSIDKTDLIMEAYHMFKDGFKYQLNKKDIEFLNRCTIQNEVHILEYEMICKHYNLPTENSLNIELTSSDILKELQGHTSSKLNLNKIGKSMKKLGFQQTSKREKGKVKRVWTVIADR